jgi:hypothetical protein
MSNIGFNNGDPVMQNALRGTGSSVNHPGAPCTGTDGKSGTIQTVNGQLKCVVPGEPQMNSQMTESPMGIRFSSPSRDQLAKQIRYWDIHKRILTGLNGFVIHQIQGAPGNWYFDIEANQYNQWIDPKNIHNKLVAGVTFTPLSPGSVRPTFDSNPSDPRVIKERVARSVRSRILGEVDYPDVVDPDDHSDPDVSPVPGAGTDDDVSPGKGSQWVGAVKTKDDFENELPPRRTEDSQYKYITSGHDSYQGESPSVKQMSHPTMDAAKKHARKYQNDYDMKIFKIHPDGAVHSVHHQNWNAGLSYPHWDVQKGRPGDRIFHKESIDLRPSRTESYGVFMKGGSIGSKNDPNKPIKVHDTEQDAKDHAKRMNKMLSPGEKNYYRIKYSHKKVESVNHQIHPSAEEVKIRNHARDIVRSLAMQVKEDSEEGGDYQSDHHLENHINTIKRDSTMVNPLPDAVLLKLKDMNDGKKGDDLAKVYGFKHSGELIGAISAHMHLPFPNKPSEKGPLKVPR